MDASQFLAEFGYIVNAPRGVARLRELVLQLAISGRLVERVSADTPVDDSLDLASEQRTAYESELDLRTTRNHPPITFSPFSIPEHWRWVRLEQLALYIQRGRGPKYSDRGVVSVVSQKCIQWSGFDIKQARWITDESVASYGKERFLRQGDLLWNSTGTGTAGRIAIFHALAEARAVADSHVTVIRLANSLPRYLWCVIASPWLQARIHPTHPDSLVSGTTQQVELATSTARGLAVPCPPIEEQSHIVAKVDELMALCDQLEAQRQDRRKLQNSLRQSTLKDLASTQSPHELGESWQRLQANFGHLFSEPGDVEDLRLLAMKLAVRGLLTQQRDEEEPSVALLDRIANEQRQMVLDGVMKRPKPLPEIDTTDAPFELPKGWSWARFPELGFFGRGKSKHRPRNDPVLFNPGIYPLVQTGEVARSKGVVTEYHSKYSKLGLEQSKLWPKGTLCITIAANIADAAILGFDACFPDSVVGFLPASEIREHVEYFLLFMRTARSQLLEFAPSTAQKNINLEILQSVLIPVPPIAEIKRILENIHQINLLCDRLAKERSRARELGELLSVTAVAALTGVTLVQEEETPVKAPQTELIAPLRLGMEPDVKAQAPLATFLVRHNGEMSARDLWQRFGGEIDAFYAQLKTEVAHGWIAEPSVAQMREVLREKAPEATGA